MTRHGPAGMHYGDGVMPVDLIDEYDLDFYEGSVVKYVARHRRKGGVDDLEKALWYLNRLLVRERSRADRSARDLTEEVAQRP